MGTFVTDGACPSIWILLYVLNRKSAVLTVHQLHGGTVAQTLLKQLREQLAGFNQERLWDHFESLNIYKGRGTLPGSQVMECHLGLTSGKLSPVKAPVRLVWKLGTLHSNSSIHRAPLAGKSQSV